MGPRTNTSSLQASSRRRAMAISLVTIFVLVTVKTVSENIQIVHDLEEGTYKFLQNWRVTAGTTVRPHVLVVDIGDLKPERWERDGRSDLATPRGPLKEMIQVFADLDARAIGVDVDFSPENGQVIHPDDPQFFDWCLQLSEKRNIPILLGVHRTFKQPYKWLGDDRYMRLAAFIAIRKGGNYEQLPHWIRTKNGFLLRSMGAALAGADVNATGSDESPWTWAIRSTSIIKPGPDLESKESLIDYAPLQRIREDALPMLPPEAFRKMKDKIEGRMVILGDIRPESGDMFQSRVGPIPGVFIHASGANTIATEPLYRLTLLGRIAIDVLLALLILVLVEFSLWLQSRFGRSSTHAEYWWNVIFTLLVVILVLTVSVGLIHWTRLLWTDFVVVCAVLLVQLLVDIFRSRSKA